MLISAVTALAVVAGPVGSADAAGAFKSVSAGQYHTCAVKADDTLACWGSNTHGQTNAPAGAFKSVSAGFEHSCAVRSDDTIHCWGDNSEGQARLRTNASMGPLTFKSVSAGRLHTCAVRVDDAVECWGHYWYAHYHGYGDGSAGAFKSVSAAHLHSCAVKVDSTLACWGSDADGESNPPAGAFESVSAGVGYGCAVKADSTLACWGSNQDGQANPPAGAFKSVSAGAWHTCAIKADNRLACWGDNGYGQTIAPAGAFKSVSAGYWHTCAVKADDTLACWGLNQYGQTTVPVNTAPSLPGTPALTAGSSSPNNGVFELAWSASTDPEANQISYRLDHKDADDAGYSAVTGADSLGGNSHAFASGAPEAEGTWTYRVRASDGSLKSAYSGASAAVKVDRSKPNAPTLSISSGQSPTTVAGNDWYKDSVSVDVAANGDPALPDGSAGSGVDPGSYSSPFSVTTNGTSTAARNVKDVAGNESLAGEIEVAVDAADPTVSIAGCPGAPVKLASSQSVTVTAADGESGLAADPSGTVSLDTASVGEKTKTVTAADRVGHVHSASCSYQVIYDWGGFLQPIDNKDASGNYVLNLVKAGTAVPVKFSLDGAPVPGSNTGQGPDVLAAGSPGSSEIGCSTTASLDQDEEAPAAGASSLSYDAKADHYVYVWKTDKLWAGRCRQLVVKLADGTEHRASFEFVK